MEGLEVAIRCGLRELYVAAQEVDNGKRDICWERCRNIGVYDDLVCCFNLSPFQN
jgi:hypothetical protein